jgi:hypothetical protein
MSIAASKTIIRAVVPKSVAMTIDRMAKASGKSRSAVIAEFLVEVEPAFKRLAGMLEVAKAQQSLFPKSAVADLEAALDDLSGNAVEVLDKVDKALQLPLEARREGGSARAPKASRASRTPRRSRRRTPV